jgi:hypothetical protein
MIEITAEIRCMYSYNNPSYRLYVDGDLITERSWAWDHEHTLIEEKLYVNIEPGPHEIKVVSHDNPRSSRFRLGTVCVNGKPVHVQEGRFEFKL